MQISYVPRRDDYIATEVLKNGPVRDYFLTTNIRTVLNKFFMPSEFDRSVADPRKFYFAIRDIDIQASCVCNGMSNQCSPEVQKNYIYLEYISYNKFSVKIFIAIWK